MKAFLAGYFPLWSGATTGLTFSLSDGRAPKQSRRRRRILATLLVS